MQNATPLYFSAPLDLAPPADGEALPTRFSGTAYSGGIADQGWLSPVVIDLATTSVADSLPLLYEHERDDIIGVVNRIEKTDTTLSVAGTLFSDIDEDAAALAQKAARGLRCQMSVGLFASSTDEIGAGNVATVNGRQFTGPCLVLRNGIVREVSIVALGADRNTNAQFFSALTSPEEHKPMSEPNPLQAQVEELQAQVADLTAKLAEAEAKTAAAESAKAEIELSARKSEIAALFTDIGREPTDEAMAPYIKLSAEAWKLVSGDLKSAHKPIPEYLFSAQATGNPAEKRTPSLNPSDIYAARRNA